MKRPRMLFLIAGWCCVGLSLEIAELSRTAREFRTVAVPAPVDVTVLPIALLIFMIWQSGGLLQLKWINRWLAVGILGWWSLTMTLNAIVAIVHAEPNRGRIASVLSVFVGINAASICFLSRKKFREFAVRYATEREKEKISRTLQEASEKKLRCEIRKMGR